MGFLTSFPNRFLILESRDAGITYLSCRQELHGGLTPEEIDIHLLLAQLLVTQHL